MSALARITAHYIEQVARRAGLRGFDEARVELESAGDEDTDQVKRLERRVEELERRLQQGQP